MFKSIITQEPMVPPEASSSLVGLLKLLLDKNQDTRMNEVGLKAHAFYAAIDWDDLLRKEVKPPYKVEVCANPLGKWREKNRAKKSEESAGHGDWADFTAYRKDSSHDKGLGTAGAMKITIEVRRKKRRKKHAFFLLRPE